VNRKTLLSRHQFGGLRYIASHDVTVDSLRACKDSTLWSLFYRGYLAATGGTVRLSSAGQEAYDTYRMASMPERKTEADLTARSQALLAVARAKSRKSRAA
jgi:hypothetical protein